MVDSASRSHAIRQRVAQDITPSNFQPFGQAIFPVEDGIPYGDADAQLDLSQGTPRFYIMRLHRQGLRFQTITRHRRCTQCLGALAGQTWYMAVAPPSGDIDQPDLEQMQVFRVPGNCFIKLDVGTWHAGPYFEAETVDFYNLELSNTNIVDHQTCNLMTTYQLEFEIQP